MSEKTKEKSTITADIDLLTISQLENLLQISRRTIDKYCKNPNINFPKKIKIGRNSRFRRKDIEDWINNNCITALYTYTNNKIVIESYKTKRKDIMLSYLTPKKMLLSILKEWEIKENLKFEGLKVGNFLFFNRIQIEKDYLTDKSTKKIQMTENVSKKVILPEIYVKEG